METYLISTKALRIFVAVFAEIAGDMEGVSAIIANLAHMVRLNLSSDTISEINLKSFVFKVKL